MKKYIIPDTQIMGMIQPSILCGSNDGINPDSATPTPPSGKPGGAPKRVFF